MVNVMLIKLLHIKFMLDENIICLNVLKIICS